MNQDAFFSEITRGDIYYVVNSDQADNKYNRPAVIVSNNANNRFSSYLEVVYLTSKEKKPLPTHVSLTAAVPSTVLCESIDTVHRDSIQSFIRRCSDEEMRSIDKALLCSIGLLDKSKILETENIETEARLYKRLYNELLDKILKGGAA